MAVADAVYVRVPDEDEFSDDSDYLDADDLADLLTEAIRRFPRLSVIEDHGLVVKVLWKKKGGKAKGHPTWGRCQIASGLVGHFSRADAVIWLAADHCKAEEYTTEQVIKLLYHQARHLDWEDGTIDKDGIQGDGRPIITGPAVSLFEGEIKDTGAWDRVRRAAATEFAQPGLGL